MVIDNPLQATSAPLTAVLRRLALDIAEAQAALDTYAEQQLEDASERGDALPPVAFYFPEIEVNLSFAFSIARVTHQNSSVLTVAPTNPVASGFFQSTSFSSHLRARIAPRISLLPAQEKEQHGE